MGGGPSGGIPTAEEMEEERLKYRETLSGVELEEYDRQYAESQVGRERARLEEEDSIRANIFKDQERELEELRKFKEDFEITEEEKPPDRTEVLHQMIGSQIREARKKRLARGPQPGGGIGMDNSPIASSLLMGR